MSFKEELQQAADKDRLVVGTKETIKEMEELEEVVLAANTPEDLRAQVEEAAGDADVDVDVFDGTNAELGSLCGKPFAASTVGIKKVTEL